MTNYEEALKRALEYLGEKWLLHPANAPKKGVYDNKGRPCGT
jgi:hypothetical protein